MVAANQGMQHVMVETDSQTLVKALQTDEFDRAQGGVLFREAKFLMATMFSSASVVHVHRSCNSVAHELARAAIGSRNGGLHRLHHVSCLQGTATMVPYKPRTWEQDKNPFAVSQRDEETQEKVAGSPPAQGEIPSALSVPS